MDKIKLTSYIKDIGLKNKMFKIIDKANGCLKNYDVRYSDFLNPFEVENAKAILNSNDDLEKMVEKEKELISKNDISDYLVSDESLNDELVKKVVFKEKNQKGITYVNTVYYKKLGENKIIKVLFSASESKQKEDYSIIYKAIIDSIEHGE